MPDTYRVKLSDGRTVRVQSDSGPPSEDAVLAQLAQTPAPPPAMSLDPRAGLPPKGPPSRTDAQDLDTLKNFLNLSGAVLAATPFASATLPMRMGMAAFGGGVGRAAGHGLEAVDKTARGDATGPSLSEDIGQGFVEGAGAEVAPAILGQGLKYGGRGLRIVGNAFGGREAAPLVRAVVGHQVGGPVGAAVTTAGPPIAAATGRGLERAGEAIGPRTLSQHVDAAIDFLKQRLNGAERPVIEPPTGAQTRWGFTTEKPYRMDPDAPTYGPRGSTTPPPEPPPGGWTPEGPAPGESFEGYPRVTPTEGPRWGRYVPEPGESLPGYPRMTTTPPPVSATPSVLDELLNEPVRAVGRPATPLETQAQQDAAAELARRLQTPTSTELPTRVRSKGRFAPNSWEPYRVPE